MLIDNLNFTLNEVLIEVMKHHGYTSDLFDTLDKIFPKNWINNEKLQVKASSILWYLHLQNPEFETWRLLHALGEILSPILEYNLKIESFTIIYDNN